MKEFILYRPFGPVIYSNLLDDDCLEIINECRRVSEYVKEDYSYQLAGAVETQVRLIRTIEQEEVIKNHILQHLSAYIGVPENITKEKYYIPDNSIWLNVQKPGDFNPPHHHDGQFSGVLYLQVPNEIKEEQEKKKIGFKHFGSISFYYGEDISCSTYFHLFPQEGQILIFPSKLQHAVHPFYSDVQRVSVAFNIFKHPDPRI